MLKSPSLLLSNELVQVHTQYSSSFDFKSWGHVRYGKAFDIPKAFARFTQSRVQDHIPMQSVYAELLKKA